MLGRRQTVDKYTEHTFTQADYYAPFEKHKQTTEIIEKIGNNNFVNKFNTRQYKLEKENTKIILQDPKNTNKDIFTAGKDIGILVKAVSPPVGIYFSTRLPGNELSVQEKIIRTILKETSTLATRKFQACYKIDKDFELLTPHVYTEGKVEEIKIEKDNDLYTFKKSENGKVKLIVQYNNYKPVYTSPNDVNLKERINLSNTYVDELLHGEEIEEE